MEVNIERIPSESAHKIKPLYEAYIREMVGERRPDTINQHFSSLAKYWSAQSHWPYWIYAWGELAGFCLLRNYPGELSTYDIEQFFVKNEFKRRGVGAEALRQVLGRHPGNWLVRVLQTNEAARLFWCRAVAKLTGLTSSETRASKCISSGSVLTTFNNRVYRDWFSATATNQPVTRAL
ncbi:GNAT family N-acetyltransferase [Gilvimarinus sp. F26214L]|uniref:GNAT family N-acetyltransferase n=1 Tax=Gilvimarinus sp. DZF01 TaxID=3461371 RepID=UPI0040462491